jgi:hypothetical protein
MTFATISSFLSIGRPGFPFRVIAMQSSLDNASMQSLISIVEDCASTRPAIVTHVLATEFRFQQ